MKAGVYALTPKKRKKKLKKKTKSIHVIYVYDTSDSTYSLIRPPVDKSDVRTTLEVEAQ